ncbi:MAG: HDOD domain-containing protein [Ignavibacteriota bacterium]
MISLAVKPILFQPKPETLWPHSVAVAELAEQLACVAGGVDPGEAYLAGLLHDVGRIALREAALYDAARVQGLVESGCPATYAEELILRTDHAELGAQIAREWRLPEPLAVAIRQHHHPEATNSRLAHVLYLAEYLSNSNEDPAVDFAPGVGAGESGTLRGPTRRVQRVRAQRLARRRVNCARLSDKREQRD